MARFSKEGDCHYLSLPSFLIVRVLFLFIIMSSSFSSSFSIIISELYEMQAYLQMTRSRWLTLLGNLHPHTTELSKSSSLFSCGNEQRILEHLDTYPLQSISHPSSSSHVWIDDRNISSSTYPLNESHEQSLA